jgi:hypothetical protein
LHSTGFVFFDIDNKDNEFNIETLDMARVYAAYRSVGGTGYHVIAKAEGINSHNFDMMYPHIATWLNLTESYDRNAVKKTQPSIISADSTMHINTQCEIFYPSHDIININNNTVSTPRQGSKKVFDSTNNKEGRDILASSNTFSLPNHAAERDDFGDYREIRFNNLRDLKWTDRAGKQIAFQYFAEKRDFVFATIPCGSAMKYSVHSVLCAYAATILYLNPWLNGDGLKYWIDWARTNLTKKSSKKISSTHSIAVTVFKQLEAGTLEAPQSSIQCRKIVFNPSLGVPKGWQSIVGEHRRQETMQRVYDAIEAWTIEDGKLNAKRLREKLKMSSQTIYRCLNEGLQDYLETRKEEILKKQ